MSDVTLLGTLRLVGRDLRAHRSFFLKNPAWSNGVSWYAHPGWVAVLVYRWGRYFHHKPGLKIVARLFYLLNLLLTKSEMTPVSDLGPGFVVIHPGGNIVASAKSGRDCVFTGGGLGGGGSQKDIGAGPGQPVLEDEVFFGRQAFALGAYRVRSRAALGPKCFVHRDLEEGEFQPAQTDDLTLRKLMGGKKDVRLDDDVYYTPTGVLMGEQDGRK